MCEIICNALIPPKSNYKLKLYTKLIIATDQPILYVVVETASIAYYAISV